MGQLLADRVAGAVERQHEAAEAAAKVQLADRRAGQPGNRRELDLRHDVVLVREVALPDLGFRAKAQAVVVPEADDVVHQAFDDQDVAALDGRGA